MEPAAASPSTGPALAFSPGERPELMAALRRRLLGDASPPPLEIHRDDYMFRFLHAYHHGFRELALVDYLRSGRSVARLLRQILAWRFGEERRAIRLLDFASGFGRTTRFYLDDLAPQQVWVSDIFPEAVAFQQRLFGVHGFASAEQPAALQCSERFDAIMVASLFSHLPKESFAPWVARLVKLVAPGGLLLISVDDASQMPPDLVLEEGFCFREGSEIPDLDRGTYGVTWVSEELMDRVLTAATGGQGVWQRLPRALWSYQDLYVIAPDGAWPPSPPLVQGEPVGILYDCALDIDGRSVEVRGWAAGPGNTSVERVEVSLQGVGEVACAPTSASESVDRLLGRAPGEPVEWACTLTSSEPIAPEALLAVEAVARNGERFLVHLGPVQSSQLYLRCVRARAEARRHEVGLQEMRLEKDGVIHQLETRLAAMEASRFWQLRNLWWRARGAAGLGQELPGRPATRR